MTAAGVPSISVRGLTKTYGEREALRGVDLEVPSGVCFGVFGPNGSGKTTLFKILSTLIRPTSGEVRVAGRPLPKEARWVREQLAVLLDRPFFPDDFTLAEGLRYTADLYQVANAAERIDGLARRVGLQWRLRDPLRTFSRGMAQRASLACALLSDPQILLLDEPFTGLDRAGCTIVEEEVEAFCARGRTVLLVTHELGRGAKLCDEAVVFDRGEIVFRGQPGEWGQADLEAVYQ